MYQVAVGAGEQIGLDPGELTDADPNRKHVASGVHARHALNLPQ
jgi:hypothetical protein